MAASTIVVLLFAVGTVAGYHWYENRDIATMTVSAWGPGYPQFGLGGYVAYEGHYYGVQDPPWSHSVRGTITLVHVPEPVPGQPYTPSDHPSARFTHDGKTISLSNSMHSCPIS